jgi:hypothetical protein
MDCGVGRRRAQQPDVPFTEGQTQSNNGWQRGRTVAAPLRPDVAPRVVPGSLGALVGAFKSATAKRINRLRGEPGAPLWQRTYYEHIIRNEADLTRIRQYIRDNPLQWDEDPDNPSNIRYRRAQSLTVWRSSASVKPN